MEEFMTAIKEMKWKKKLLIILACIAGILATFVFQITPSVLGFIGLFVLSFMVAPYFPRGGGGGGGDGGGGDGGGGDGGGG